MVIQVGGLKRVGGFCKSLKLKTFRAGGGDTIKVSAIVSGWIAWKSDFGESKNKKGGVKVRQMEAEYFDIHGLSQYLSIKKSTLYSKVEAGEIPFYRIGRLIRFRKEEVDRWMEHQRQEIFDPAQRAKAIVKPAAVRSVNVDRLVRNSIEDVLKKGYTPSHGRPDQNTTRKEVQNGSV